MAKNLAQALCALLLLTSTTPIHAEPSYSYQHELPNSIYPNSPRPLQPPALTYIPPIGLGTWLSKSSSAQSAVKSALDAGYRHIDAAAIYGNEKYVGAGLNASGLPRQNIWITSKLWNDHHRPSDVRPALEKTLSDLGVEYLDLYLMHWPVAFNPDKKGSVIDKDISILDTWFAMEQLVRAGLTKNIGISNFAKHEVETILKHCRICPAAHEFETHPYLQQQAFVTWHARKGIQVIAYSPFANLNPIYDSGLPSILEDPFWVGLAKTKGASVPQTLLAWGMQRGTVVIPKSVHEGRIVENLASSGVRLNGTEMEAVAAQDRRARFNNPSKSWKVDLFDDLDGV